MKKSISLARWLKCILIGLAFCGVVVYGLILPILGLEIIGANPDHSSWFWPWLIFLWLTAPPCYAACILGWRVAGNIGKGKSFTQQNANLLKWIAVLAAGDALFFFAGNILYWLLGMHHPGCFLLALLAVFAGAAISVAAAALSHLTARAADIQDENDLTI